MDTELKKLRKKKNMSQRDAAGYLRMSLKQYIKAEKGVGVEDSLQHRVIINRLKLLNPVDETRGLLSIDEIQEACNNTFKQYSVDYAYLFGLYANGTAKEDSSVNILINTDVVAINYHNLKNKIQNALNKKTVLLSIDQIVDDKMLIDRILREGRKVYEKK